MKTTKRIFACLLIVVMLASMLCVGASAVDITINAPDGVTYTVYKVFDLEASSVNAVLYTWPTSYDTDQITPAITGLLNVSPDGYITLKDGTDEGVITFANAVVNNGHYDVADTVTIAGSSGTVTLDNGYYVMRDNATSAVVTFSVINGTLKDGSSTTISSKAELPNITKTVNDDKVSAVDPITYTITIVADDSAKNYTVVDTPSGVDNITVTSITADEAITPSDYTITIPTDGTSLTVEFTADYLAKLDATEKIVITYTAKLADSFVTGTNPNTNTAVLTYGDTGSLSKQSSVNVYTGEINFDKAYDKGTPSSGAKFVIINSATSKYAIIDNGVLAGWSDTITPETTITTGSSTITVKGFDLGTYILHETDAPNGYRVAADTPVTVSVATPDGIKNPDPVTITNIAGDPLPETGGIGTTVFYAAGGILVLGALVVLLMKKRSVTE